MGTDKGGNFGGKTAGEKGGGGSEIGGDIIMGGGSGERGGS